MTVQHGAAPTDPVPVVADIATVADDEVVWFVGATRREINGVRPGTEVDVQGVTVRTLDRPGELLCRFATINDVHFGETVAGVVSGTDIGPTFSVPDGEEPYPEFMNRGAVAAMAAIDPAVVLAKGDLTASGVDAEYQRFIDVYRTAFGDRLMHIRGNHDAYHGATFADTSVQSRDLPGVTVAMIDTSRIHQVNGSVGADQLEWLDELAARADRPVLLFGHHHIWNPDRDPRRDDHFGIRPTDSEALIEVFVRRKSLVGYFAGHTHRNHRQLIEATGDVPWVEVACVKDYPGSWAEYRVFDGGILQIHRRIDTPEALAWSEQTRHMYRGAYAAYASGTLQDRCFPIPI